MKGVNSGFILNTNYKDISLAKQNINEHAFENGKTKARFNDNNYNCAAKSRNVFLNSLRKKLYTICKSLETNNIIHACNLILDSGKNHIIANYRYDKEDAYLCIIPNQKNADYKEINLRGNDSVRILLADYEIGFRYKFESGITSSIKLVGDYKSNNN